MIRGILLDFYGTVVEEDDPVIGDIVAVIAGERPGELTPDHVASVWNREFKAALRSTRGGHFRTQRELTISSLAAVLDECGSSLDPEELCAAQFTFWRRPPLRAGSLEFVRSCPVPICVVSNIDSDDLDHVIRLHDLPLPTRVTSEDARSYKPEADMFVAALEALMLGPADVLHVGDSLSSDVAGAQALGIPTAWVNATGRTAHDSHGPDFHGPDFEVSDLRELLPLIAASRMTP